MLSDQVPNATPRLSIYDKLKILDYAEQVKAEHKKKIGELMKKTKSKKKRAYNRQFWKGMNLQKACENKFKEKLGKIKVCQMRKQAEQQQWRSLPEFEQRRMTQLSDSMKVSLGLDDSVKGWKALPLEKKNERLEDMQQLPRWNIPAKVLEEPGSSTMAPPKKKRFPKCVVVKLMVYHMTQEL